MAGPFKMKAGKEGPMKKNFPSAFKQDTAETYDDAKKRKQREKDVKENKDITSKTSPGPGYKKIKGTNTWEHTKTKNNKEKNLRDEKLIAEQAGYVGPVGRR